MREGRIVVVAPNRVSLLASRASEQRRPPCELRRDREPTMRKARLAEDVAAVRDV